MNINFDDDFGFTAVDERDLNTVKDSTKAAKNNQKKVEDMAFLINIFIDKLMSTPDKDYIYWPAETRTKKLNDFKKRIKDIIDR